MNKKYTVYMHINKINNKKYIGLTKQSCQERWRHDGIGYKSQIKFWNAIQKYGWNNFEHKIIAEQLTEKEASELEIKLIKQYDCINNGYNVSFGGSTTNHSPETLEKMRQSMLGKKHTQETKNKISQSKNKEKIAVKCITTNIVYESERQAMLETGIDISSISKCCKGEVCQAGGLEWEYVDEILKKQYETIKLNKKDKRFKPVQCLNTGKIYQNVQEAARDTNSDPSNITKVCNGKYKTTNKLKWRFVTNDNEERKDYEE